ncbi:MAG TPA: hypothetical protein VEL05_04585, partial [Candidatus Acidoferrum sp.]|nr:hypothetical protein [Candidatus Acidoferrum sp.]
FAHAEPDCERPAPSPARIANLTFFLTHDAHAVRRYRLDWTALESASSRLVLAVGAASRGNWLHASASALAGRIGTPLVEFPGGHAGFSTHPRAFSARLLEVLGRP